MQVQVAGRIRDAGVHTPDACVPAEAYVHELGRRGTELRRPEEGARTA